ncbi:RICIN domain-containing protein [Paenibacillus sp. HW567]
MLINTNSNKVVDIPGGNIADGACLQIHTANGTTSQQWKLIRKN